MSDKRVFFALWPDETTREAVMAASREAVEACGGKAVPEDNFHITLRFLGNASGSDIRKMKKAAKAANGVPQKFTLDRLGYWAGPEVLWMGCQKANDDLLRLVVNLNTELGSVGFPHENRPFRPHVTLARKVESEPESSLISPIEWSSESFVLVESELADPKKGGKHSEYKVIASFDLK
ncbi:MAG: RNA 2',3'-cyclic phosphodiesterase [Gammaproteobacteria bacterium]|nr:RNA 2',3'-cyclic phosphodiesterase [Gammaproteobacteria bacterium]